MGPKERKIPALLLTGVFLLAACFTLAQQNTTLSFGDQKWMSRNLDVSKFANGDPIPEAKTNEAWKAAGQDKRPAWCYYNNDPANGPKYGKLYNWYAIADPRGIAPKGWHVPGESEWKVLIEYLGGENSAGQKMKSAKGWDNNGNGNNSGGYGGLPVGMRYYNGPFDFGGKYGKWWSSKASDGDETFIQSLYFDTGSTVLGPAPYGKGAGHAVRCIKDGSATTATWPLGHLSGTADAAVVVIGKQEWMPKNLNVSTFANGDVIPEAKTDQEWKKAGEEQMPAWCYFNNDPSTEAKFGKLYNWYAVNDPRGLAPKGWRLPGDSEWIALVEYLGGESHAGIKMKSVSDWNDNGNGNNRSAFEGVPVGTRNYRGEFDSFGRFGSWWSASKSDSGEVSCRSLYSGSETADKSIMGKAAGASVRCIK